MQSCESFLLQVNDGNCGHFFFCLFFLWNQGASSGEIMEQL